MPPQLRIRWQRAARIDIAVLDAWSQGGAEAVRREMEQMAEGGWSLGRPIPGGRRWWAARTAPVAVVYRVRGRQLIVQRVISPKTLRGPLP